MRHRPRVVIHNHRGRDENKASSELNMPWEKRQVINDALAHIKRTCGVVPDAIATGNQIATVKRALGQLRQEVDVAIKLLLEK
jgi:hypothetical protein